MSPREMTPDGLANAIATHLAAMRDSDNPQERSGASMWAWCYVTELHRRAEIAEQPACLRRTG